MRYSRIWAMPDKWTFTIQPIRELVYKYIGSGQNWIDPFAGKNSPAELTNDLNPNRPTNLHLDGLTFIKKQPSNTFSGILYDPPYSFTQAKECYDNYGADLFNDHEESPTNMGYWGACKGEIQRIIKVGGIAICCGWNTNGVGHNRGFEMLEILIVPHGGSKNDTLVTVERKIQSDFL